MATIDDVYQRCYNILEKCMDILSVLEGFELNNYAICTMCHGDGEVVPSYTLADPPPDTIECTRCSGEGKMLIGTSAEKD